MEWKGLPRDVLRDAGLTRRDDGVTVIPYRDRTGSTAMNRYVAESGARWWDRGAKLMPYGLELVAAGRGRLVIVEGESDTLAVRAYAPGYLALGCPGTSVWRPEWIPLLDPFDTVLVAGDGDQAGRSFTRRLVTDYPRAIPVWLDDGEDVRGVAQGPGDLDDRFARAIFQRRAFSELEVCDTVSLWERRVGRAVRPSFL